MSEISDMMKAETRKVGLQMGAYVIETRELTKQYGAQICVNRINLHVPEGKIYGLLGRNGAGKTTTMKMLLRLAKPTDGSIFLFGEDIKNADKSLYYRIGSLIEAPGFYENLTAEENLGILARLRGEHRKDSVNHALTVAGLEKERKKVFRHYSLGMKQRLGIAAAIMHEPELLILDEPINGLDPVGIHEIRNFLSGLCRERGVTILLSSHMLSEIEQLADVIGVIHEGRLLEEADMESLRKQNRKYAAFEVSDVNAAAMLLEKNCRIDDYAVIGEGEIRLFEKIDDRAAINKVFAANGIAVRGIFVREETLEEHFMKLTGGGEIG